MPETWKAIAEKAQSERDALIPKEWRLDARFLNPAVRDVTGVPAACGLLTADELAITALDATDLVAGLRTGRWTAEAVCVAFCKRAAVAHQLVNCLTETCFDTAVARARELDALWEATADKSTLGALHGLPVSVKDHIDAAGLRSTLGFCCLADNRPAADSVLVAALRAAGAVVYVKTTMPVTGMAIETVSQLWGRTTNPANRALVAGGSSGGEGALLALRGSPLGLGTDIGGSIRVPSAFNGLYGIRPTTRRLSYMGMTGSLKGSRTISGAVGPMGHSVRDLALLCETALAAKPWVVDPVTVVPVPWDAAAAKPADPQTKLRIGFLRCDGVVLPHPPVLRALDTVAAALTAAGHEVVPFAPLDHQGAWDLTYKLYYPTGGREMQALLDRTGEPWLPATAKLSAPDRDPDAKEPPTPLPVIDAQALYALHAAQDAYKVAYRRHWDAAGIDALLCPINPCACYPHDVLTWWGYASQWNLLDYPGAIVPVGRADKAVDVLPAAPYTPLGARDAENRALYDAELWHGAPTAVQLVGLPFEDERLLGVAAEVDRAVKATKQAE